MPSKFQILTASDRGSSTVSRSPVRSIVIDTVKVETHGGPPCEQLKVRSAVFSVVAGDRIAFAVKIRAVDVARAKEYDLGQPIQIGSVAAWPQFCPAFLGRADGDTIVHRWRN